MIEQWRTVGEIDQAAARLKTAIPGYSEPWMHAVGLREGETASFPLINICEHQLPAVIIATVCGHVSGSATYFLAREQLATAVDLMSPAEACRDLQHDNLQHWRLLLATSDAALDPPFVAVFVQDVADDLVDRFDAQMRRASLGSQ